MSLISPTRPRRFKRSSKKWIFNSKDCSNRRMRCKRSRRNREMTCQDLGKELILWKANLMSIKSRKWMLSIRWSKSSRRQILIWSRILNKWESSSKRSLHKFLIHLRQDSSNISLQKSIFWKQRPNSKMQTLFSFCKPTTRKNNWASKNRKKTLIKTSKLLWAGTRPIFNFLKRSCKKRRHWKRFQLKSIKWKKISRKWMIRGRQSSLNTSIRSTLAWKPFMSSLPNRVISKVVKPICPLWTSMIHSELSITRWWQKKMRANRCINWLVCTSNHQENSLT